MQSYVKKIISLMLVLLISITSGYAFDGTPETQFEYVLQTIEQNSLYTQDKIMSQEQIDAANAAIEADPNKLSEIVNSYLKTLDTHSVFLSKDEYNDAFYTIAGQSGIGITLERQEDGTFKVINTVKDSPVDRAGVQIGDIVTKINEIAITSMEVSDVSALMHGEIGDEIKLDIIRDGKNMEFVMQIQNLEIEYVSSLTVQEGIEYISVASLGTAKETQSLKEIINGLEEKDTKAIILDLRSNGGGLVNDTLEIANMLTGESGIPLASLLWREDQGGREYYISDGTGVDLEKICVLVDHNTASAAELLTGALMQSDNVDVIGTQTYGKGQAQYHMSVLSGQYMLSITCMEMELPQIGCWEGVGITPDMSAANNDIIEEALGQLPELSEERVVSFGDRSNDVLALSGRLYLLGYMNNIQQVFDTSMLEAMRNFQRDFGLTPSIAAGQQTLHQVNSTLKVLIAMEENGDAAYDTALEICQEAISESDAVGTQFTTERFAA